MAKKSAEPGGPLILGAQLQDLTSKLGVACFAAGAEDDLAVGSTFSPTPEAEGDPTVTYIKCAGAPGPYWMEYAKN